VIHDLPGLPQGGARILIYSHDTMGLGHLRRCRAIAHALVERRAELSVLILSGSPVIGSFEFRPRVDFVRIPGVAKRRDGSYGSLSLDLDIRDTLAIRAAIIRHTAAAFAPDLFLVDKEPLGLRGEAAPTLAMLKSRGVPLVLGLRDVMDDPELLAPEWKRKNVVPALRDLYDAIWIYGIPELCDPMTGIALPRSVRRKLAYTGYLRRALPTPPALGAGPQMAGTAPYILVTPGGGGDGDALIDWVLRAYESGADLPHDALIVCGPFLRPALRDAFLARADRLPRVRALTFDTQLEALMAGAAGVVAMGGYNTFCEILSFDKRALLVPRTVPRREQFIRARQAQALGLVRMLDPDGARDTAAMVAALRALPHQALPSVTVLPGLLDGLDGVSRLAGRWIDAGRARILARPRLAYARG
jgi:predicted glycosyltransferase